MKKTSVRFAILCILALLIGVTAWAASGRVSISPQVENVTVTEDPDSEEIQLDISMTNAEEGKLYTVLIRSGDETAPPSGGNDGNLVYMDVVEAKKGAEGQKGVVSVKAFPKQMEAGTYRVFMSDYGKNAIKQVATFDVAGTAGKLGDVNGDKAINMDDALAIMRHIAKVPGWDLSDKISAADVSKNGAIDMDDALAIMRHIAKVPGWDLSGQ